MSVIFLSEFLVVLSKPTGIHFDQVLTQCVGGSFNPSDFAPCHRLDFETSGLLLCPRKEKLGDWIALFKKSGSVKKIYAAKSAHPLPENMLGEHSGFIGSRYRASKSVSYFTEPSLKNRYRSVQEVLHVVRKWKLQNQISIWDAENLYEVELITGARHQIRAFFSYAGAPLLGDKLYGAPNLLPSERFGLHCYHIELQDPLTQRALSFTAPI